MKINLICCCDKNGVFAVDGKSITPPPGDLARFKALTMGHAVIMGGHTWDSLPVKPLPGRANIILSNTATYSTIPNVDVDVAGSIGDAVHHFAEHKRYKRCAFIIGGQRLYEEALPLANAVYLTIVDEVYEGADIRRFPIEKLNYDEWVNSTEYENGFKYVEWHRLK